MNIPPPPQSDNTVVKKQRSSNLELYRVICMLMIVAHHYVVNSGLTSVGGPLVGYPDAPNSIFLRLFGAWGKTGINCFLMITGYFMCTSQITLKKYIKLILQVYFYNIIIYLIFLFTGYESASITRLAKLALPFWGFSNGFVSCFLMFYLAIPFWNILIRNMTQRQHLLLLMLLFTCYTLFGNLPTFNITFNYITWFGVIYVIASYIRLYPTPVWDRRTLWGWLTLASVLVSMVSVVMMNKLFAKWDYFLADSNKIFAVLVAVCSFLWFKNMNIKYSKVINAFGAATFGVLLIHANSDAMRVWLWNDTIDTIGHYYLPLGNLILYCVVVVLLIFVACNLIDQLRIATFEKWFFRWYDNKVAEKADALINRLTSNNQ